MTKFLWNTLQMEGTISLEIFYWNLAVFVFKFWIKNSPDLEITN